MPISIYTSHIKLKNVPQIRCWNSVIRFGVDTNTGRRSVSPPGSPEQHPVIFFIEKHFPFYRQTPTEGGPTGALRDRASSSRLTPRQRQHQKCFVCLWTAPTVFSQDEDLRDEEDEFTSQINPDSTRSRSCSRSDARKIKKNPRTSLLLHTYDKHSSTTTAKSLLF